MTLDKIKTFFTSLGGAIAALLLVVTSVSVWWFGFNDQRLSAKLDEEQRIISHNAAVVSDSVITRIEKRIDPLSTTEFQNYRDSTATQIERAKSIALNYMNTIDLLNAVISDGRRTETALMKRIEVLEVELKVTKAKTRDEGLQVVMNTLEKILNDRSQNQKLDSILTAIRERNEKQIDQIRSGDRMK